MSETEIFDDDNMVLKLTILSLIALRVILLTKTVETNPKLTSKSDHPLKFDDAAIRSVRLRN